VRTCPETGRSCFYLDCAQGCAGYEVQVEAVTVVHTTIRRRVSFSLAGGPGRRAPEPETPPALPELKP
jgi:hypothetical protein